MESQKETDWWWVDYLENEMDPSLEKDLEELLKCSASDRAAFDKISLVRRWLSESDPAKGLPVEAAAKRVRRKVMAVLFDNADWRLELPPGP